MKKKTKTAKKATAINFNFMGSYFTTSMQLVLVVIIFMLGFVIGNYMHRLGSKTATPEEKKNTYWFVLYRKSQVELLYKGDPGSAQQSSLVKTFVVKTGIPGQKPTPLPQLSGKKYWIITDKIESGNPETAPYFLTLNIPLGEEEPFGPSPYLECDGQCNWEVPGAFGLHGVNGDMSRLSFENEGSSGCIRHKDEDITYLYNLLDPHKEEIRYYIEDI